MNVNEVIRIENEHMEVRGRYAEIIGKLQAAIDIAIIRLDDRLIDNVRQGMTTGHDAQRLEVLVAQLERALAESERAWKGE